MTGIGVKGKNHIWWVNTKISADFLEPVFSRFSEELNIPHILRKGDYFRLADIAQKNELDSEIKEKLDVIYGVASSITQ